MCSPFSVSHFQNIKKTKTKENTKGLATLNNYTPKYLYKDTVVSLSSVLEGGGKVCVQ